LLSFIIVAKDDPQLETTLRAVSAQAEALDQDWEILVVDASGGRMDHIRATHPRVRWFDYEQPAGRGVTIPHQRNLGVRHSRGEVIVFIDASCVPDTGWLPALIRPLQSEGEPLAAGSYRSSGARGIRDEARHFVGERRYLDEAPTLNLAVARRVFELIGAFDESFDYGSDVDFTWRLNDAGYRVRHIPDAVIRHDYGTSERQRRRSFVYGKGRARLYRKHRARRKNMLREDPVAVIYPLFLLGLPLTLVFPLYPLLLVIPAWRNRATGGFQALVDHLWFGAGVLAELAGR
jgi:cellulose synthase/poly-beta-1,6-N-acetylglucosamine synthase-like glycosyltransferase